jgi:hypothetical protein
MINIITGRGQEKAIGNADFGMRPGGTPPVVGLHSKVPQGRDCGIKG